MKSCFQMLTLICLFFFVAPVGAISGTTTPTGNNTTIGTPIVKVLPSDQEVRTFLNNAIL